MSEINENSGEELVEEVTYTVEDADVIPTPIDPTLTHPGEAADAKATGDAIRGMGQNININGVRADLSGTFNLYAANIPMSGEQGAQTVDDVLNDIGGRTGADIMLEEDGSETVAAAVTALGTSIGDKLDSGDIDDTLTQTGKVADAKAAGDAISAVGRVAVKSVNQFFPDASGNVTLRVAPLAENLLTSKTHESIGDFSLRTTGGDVSIESGSAYLRVIKGNSVHTGVVHESLVMNVIPIDREEEDEPITATIDADVFRNYVQDSAVITLYYTTEWSADPALYGITVTGTPLAGDQIIVSYTKADRGTITTAVFNQFISTGWNLFDYANSRARVFRYSEQYGYYIGGDYTSLSYSTTISGDRTPITVTNRLFTVPGTGYVFVDGAVEGSTYIIATWSDWLSGSPNTFEAYTESVIDLSALMTELFPYGLMRIGTVRDEISLDDQLAISRVERLEYTSENLAAAEASGRAYDADTDYIYIVRETPEETSIQIDPAYQADDHGYEYLYNPAVPAYVETLYGVNLRNKLERDVVTFSAQTETSARQAQARTNIGAASQTDLVAANASLSAAHEGIAIIANGDTHAAIASGGYVYIKGHDTLAEGLYKASTAIGTDAALTTSNVTSVSGGLGSEISTLTSKLMSQGASAWDVYPGETGQRIYKYEGANTTTYNLPWQHCVVVVEWGAATRGIAVAYRWDDNASRVNMWVNQLHGSWLGWNDIYKTINVSSLISVSSQYGIVSQKSAYRTGNMVTLAFVFTTNASRSAGQGFDIKATFTDATLKPISRQPGSTNNVSITAINIDPVSGSATANCNALGYSTVNSGAVFWLTYTYICVG